mmetsp:Transcript_12974/g.25882  ORF Transcript_12974/g.25882 Transcript_12974/m.25882 type:complete len:424 (-) Transcript_12974:549-1820(-)
MRNTSTVCTTTVAGYLMKGGSLNRHSTAPGHPPAHTARGMPSSKTPRLRILPRADNVVDLEDHLDDLGGEQQLLFLAVQRLDHLLLLHVAGARLLAVNAKPRVLLLYLPLLHSPQRINSRHPAVLRQRHRNRLQRICKRAHRVLVDARHVLRGLHDGKVARDFCGAASVHDAVVAHEVAHDAEAVVDGAFDLLDDHLVRAAHENRHGLAVLAVLHKQHLVLGRPERHLAHAPRSPELLRCELGKPRHDARAARDGKQLDFHAADPAHCRKLTLHEQMVCLIIEPPLAYSERAPDVLDLFHHVDKVLLLLLVQRLVFLHRVDRDIVLCFRFWRLKGTCQDADFRVLNVLFHPRVADVFVKHNAVHQLRILHLPARLALHLDKIQVHVLPLEIRHRKDRFDGNIRHLIQTTSNNLGGKCCLSNFN